MRRRSQSPLLRALKALRIRPCDEGIARLLACESDEDAIRTADHTCTWCTGERFRFMDISWTAAALWHSKPTSEHARDRRRLFDGHISTSQYEEGTRARLLKFLREYRHAEAVAGCIARQARRAAR
jgi:hypothetical protein